MVYSCNVCGVMMSEGENPPSVVGKPCRCGDGTIVRGRSDPIDRCKRALPDAAYAEIAALEDAALRHERAAKDAHQRIRRIYAAHVSDDGTDNVIDHYTRVGAARYKSHARSP